MKRFKQLLKLTKNQKEMSSKGCYIEYSFVLPIYDITETDSKLVDEIIRIKQLMNLDFDDEIIIDKYNSYGDYSQSAGKGDVIVFKSNIDSEEFVVFDLYNGFTDQNNMVMIGVRCVDDNKEIKNSLIKLHERLEPTSKFIEEYGSDLLKMVDKRKYPKKQNDLGNLGNKIPLQHIECYINGELVYRV